jgi:hypothetical protein
MAQSLYDTTPAIVKHSLHPVVKGVDWISQRLWVYSGSALSEVCTQALPSAQCVNIPRTCSLLRVHNDTSLPMLEVA